MRTMTIAVCVALFAGVPAALAAQAPAYKRDVPDSLLKTAKITESRAAEIAQHHVPNGTIRNLELEREKGKLIYSFEIKVAGKAGITEVNVDAMTGHVGPLQHEKD
ncbi:MAG TPA: PepSY domain-containing protein [Gemmatimonadaceae bacterium]|nr:PepSY domain-containing protein [Gemmatimonadaceae bacterium]